MSNITQEDYQAYEDVRLSGVTKVAKESVVDFMLSEIVYNLKKSKI